jgi:chromosome partitioning protein
VLVTSVLSLKGGVGKTSVTLGLASAAVRRDISTLIVDLDPQANATLAVDPREIRLTVAQLLSDSASALAARAVSTTAWSPNLGLIAGSDAAEALNHPAPSVRALARLRVALTRIRPAPELVLIDCPPSLGTLTRTGLVASHRALLVTDPSLFGVTGVQRALQAVHDERTANQPDLQPLGVVVNRTRARSSEQDYRIAELKELFGPLILSPSLPDRAAVQQAQGAGIPIHDWPSAGAREVALAFDRLLDRLLRSRKLDVTSVAS